MKKNLQILILVCFSVLIWSCDKEVKLNRIEGTLSAGKDVSPTSLGDIPLVLAKIYDTIDFNQATLKMSSFESFFATLTDANGFYAFDSLPDGNYLIACGEGFKFVDVDFSKVSASKGSTYKVNKSVNRLASTNGPDTYTVEVKNETICKVIKIEFFVNGASHISRDITVEPGKEWTQFGYFDFVLDEDQNPDFELSVLRNDSIFTSPKLPFFGYGIFSNKVVDITHYYQEIWGKNYISKVAVMKGWWFGHFIVVYVKGGGAAILN